MQAEGPQKVPLDSLTPQQIMQVKQQFENDINVLTQSLNQFRFVFNKYEESKAVIEVSEKCGEEDQVMIPLSNSLYIPGHLDNMRDGKRRYMLDYGTGYFVERDAKQAIEFCDRKNKMIKEKSEKLAAVINQKKVMLEKCNLTLMSLMNKQQQQQAEIK